MPELNEIPCPLCGQSELVDDGIVRWRSGPQPPRSLAKPRAQLGVPPRGDYDETAYYHCAACHSNFVDYIVSSLGFSILHVEGKPLKFNFIHNRNSWEERK